MCSGKYDRSGGTVTAYRARRGGPFASQSRFGDQQISPWKLTTTRWGSAVWHSGISLRHRAFRLEKHISAVIIKDWDENLPVDLHSTSSCAGHGGVSFQPQAACETLSVGSPTRILLLWTTNAHCAMLWWRSLGVSLYGTYTATASEKQPGCPAADILDPVPLSCLLLMIRQASSGGGPDRRLQKQSGQ